MRWILFIVLLALFAEAKVYQFYPPAFDSHVPLHERVTRPHLFPGQSITTETRFNAEPLRPGTSKVRWTSYGSYAVHLDGVHLQRDSFTVRVKSLRGWQILQLPFKTTRLYLAPDYFEINYDESTHTVWLGKYAD